MAQGVTRPRGGVSTRAGNTTAIPPFTAHEDSVEPLKYEPSLHCPRASRERGAANGSAARLLAVPDAGLGGGVTGKGATAGFSSLVAAGAGGGGALAGLRSGAAVIAGAAEDRSTADTGGGGACLTGNVTSTPACVAQAAPTSLTVVNEPSRQRPVASRGASSTVAGRGAAR